MGLAGFFFILTRITQVIFLLPPLGMLSSLVHGYVTNNLLTPNFTLVLFIVVVMAFAWTVITLLFYALARHNAYLLAFVDLGLLAALIAGLVELRAITKLSCSSPDPLTYITISLGQWEMDLSKGCSLLKASFAFAIIEVLLFFNSFWLSLWVHHHHRKETQKHDRRDASHSSRHSARRSRAGSRAGSRRRSSSRYSYTTSRV